MLSNAVDYDGCYVGRPSGKLTQVERSEPFNVAIETFGITVDSELDGDAFWGTDAKPDKKDDA